MSPVFLRLYTMPNDTHSLREHNMPFTGIDDPTLPDNIKERSEEKRKVWVGAWNAAFDRCVNESGDDCEGKAFRIANSAIAENAETMSETIHGKLHIELSELVTGKAFDGMTHGKFIDMRGQRIEVKKSELKTYVKNTLAAIAATKTDSGKVVGLPIDSDNHDHGDAAGWIMSVELVGDVIRFIPKWTKLGREKVGEGLRRMFSPVFSVDQKVIGGGSLTNYPGSLNSKNGRMLLRPIELSQGGFFVAEFIEEEASEETSEEADVVTTTTQDVSVEVDGQQLKMDLSTDDQTELELQEQDMSEDAIRKIVQAELAKGLEADVARAKEQAAETDAESEESDVKNTAEAVLEMLGMDGIGETNVELIKNAMLAKRDQWQKQAKSEAMLYMAQIQREETIDQFCNLSIGGDEKHPVGLPGTAENLKAMLMSEPFERAKAWMDYLETIRESGLTSFEAMGHGRTQSGTVELDAQMGEQLKIWIDGGQSRSDFFKTNADILGDETQYNLTAFEEKQ